MTKIDYSKLLDRARGQLPKEVFEKLGISTTKETEEIEWGFVR